MCKNLRRAFQVSVFIIFFFVMVIDMNIEYSVAVNEAKYTFSFLEQFPYF